MKKILIILPLFFWLGCEEEKDEAEEVFEGFSEAWVECKMVKIDGVLETFDTPLYNYEYDSLIVLEVEWNDLSAIYHWNTYDEYYDFNEWGKIIKREEYANNVYQTIYEYQDKWKETKRIDISYYYGDEGDTMYTEDSSWDGLLQTKHTIQFDNTGNISSEHLFKILYNEYGRVLERISYSEGLTDSNRVVYTYEDGWRLILEEEYGWNSTVISSSREYQWEDNKRIYIEDINEGATSKWSSVETYNYYWKLIKRENFSYYLNDNNEWKLEQRNKLYIEYECPGFEQIYP